MASNGSASFKKKDFDNYEKLLTSMRDEIVGALGFYERNALNTSVRERTGDLSSFTSHPADMGSDTMEREETFLMASKEGRDLQGIEDALKRIRDKSFGKCLACGKMISTARLDILPTATLCIDCQAIEETRSLASAVEAMEETPVRRR